MKWFTLLLICGGLTASATETTPGFALHDGDRVVFYGDSITQAGGYAQLVEVYARTHFPDWNLRFYNAGVGGDTVRGGWAGEVGVRLPRDVIALKPTVVTIMLAMNDGGYRKLEPATLQAFDTGLRSIVTKLKEALPGVRLYLIRTSPFDDISRAPNFEPGYDAVLREMGEAVSAIGKDENIPVIDFGSTLDDGIRAVWNENHDLAQQLLPDRVHPAPAGHLVMGATLLRAWHAPALVTRVAIDAKAGTVTTAENTAVSALSVTPAKISWSQLDRALPLPFNWEDAETNLAEKAGANLESFDQQPLSVAGLPAGRYELKVDGWNLGIFTAADLAKGMNLAVANTPMRSQANPAKWGSADGQQVQLVRRRLLAFGGTDPVVATSAERLALQDEGDQVARSTNLAPKPREYVLTLVP